MVAGAAVVPGVFVPRVAALTRRWVGGPPAGPLCRRPSPALGAARVGQLSCTGRGEAQFAGASTPVSVATASAPGAGGGGGTELCNPPSADSRRPGCGTRRPGLPKLDRGPGSGRVGRRRFTFAGPELPSHLWVRTPTGRVSGRRPHTIILGTCRLHFFPGLAGSIQADAIE